jgi:TPR repeat protein
MGMAYLQGQLDLPQNPAIAMPLLQRAAFLSSIEVPQPAYVYALLLMQEFPHITLPVQLLLPLVPPAHPYQTNPSVPPPSLMSESKKYLERSAYLGFGPALYKLGQSYEHALPPFPYDPLMSVQYYSLASQQGDALADLALSKWFLVGSNPNPDDPNAPKIEGFDKDESLALIFAEKAAAKGEAGGEFAMGYYCEVGVGRPVDLKEAKGWYERAAKQNHEEAIARLKELARDNPTLLDVQEAKGRLERVRTTAMQRGKANASGAAPPLPEQISGATLSPMTGANVVAMARTSSRINHGTVGRRPKVQEFEKAAKGAATLAPPVPVATPTAASTSTAVPVATPPAASTGTSTPVVTAGTGAQAGKKPATFEEMGYHSQKLEDRECIIM